VAPAGSFAVPVGRAPAPDACGDGQVRCFNPVFYAVDTVVPLVTLGQRSTWYPNRAGPWGTVVDTWLNVATLLGWVLSSIFLLSFHQIGQDRLTHTSPPSDGGGRAVGARDEGTSHRIGPIRPSV
jgi:hypothetical protein